MFNGDIRSTCPVYLIKHNTTQETARATHMDILNVILPHVTIKNKNMESKKKLLAKKIYIIIYKM